MMPPVCQSDSSRRSPPPPASASRRIGLGRTLVGRRPGGRFATENAAARNPRSAYQLAEIPLVGSLAPVERAVGQSQRGNARGGPDVTLGRGARCLERFAAVHRRNGRRAGLRARAGATTACPVPRSVGHLADARAHGAAADLPAASARDFAPSADRRCRCRSWRSHWPAASSAPSWIRPHSEAPGTSR